ncbi:hypothetical protein P4E94_15975 [Pontiellaceae bacterium B12219]|nr:hypothetical protein [Pontiellaceae bacterium B12219]
MSQKVNFRRGLKRIYFVNLALAMVPLYVGILHIRSMKDDRALHNLQVFEKEEANKRLNEMESELVFLTKTLNVDWSDIDAYFIRKPKFKHSVERINEISPAKVKKRVQKRVIVSGPRGSGTGRTYLNKFTFKDACKVYDTAQFKTENYQNMDGVGYLEDYLIILADYDAEAKLFNQEFGNISRQYWYSDEQAMYFSFIIAVGMIVVPPIAYFLMLVTVLPFVRWIFNGFIETNDSASKER